MKDTSLQIYVNEQCKIRAVISEVSLFMGNAA